ncbi:MAG: hypothetical protein ACAH95_08415 [Fimbriimonas sp.]
MSAPQQTVKLEIPLKPQQQREITSKALARLILAILIRNDEMPANERNWKVSYYPYQLSSIRAFEIVGHANPEVPEFARKWNEAIALLKAKAFIMLDPTQDDRNDFMMPTSMAKSANLDEELGQV